MLGLVALLFAAASANSSAPLTAVSPWWEKVTFTMTGDGGPQSCVYESSLGAVRVCNDKESATPIRAGSGSTGSYTKITIERQFTPGQQPHPGSLQPGDTLLGGQVMVLAIDGNGKVRNCDVLAASGDVRPSYGCKEARAERFHVSAGGAPPEERLGFMTIVVYGHEEHLV